MAKLRRNHSKKDTPGGGMIVKIGIFAGILAVLFFVFNRFTGGEGTLEDAIEKATEIIGNQNTEQATSDETYDYYPSSSSGEIIERTHFAFSYSEVHEQAEWVAYELTRESLKVPNVPRSGDFRPDPKVRKASASPRDYKRSGYDRGHLAPAGDMAFSEKAMSETFYMTNISPQIKNFNGGIWRELEENVRNWAYKFKNLYIVTGPILSRGIRETIGDNEVAVPDEYYKVILDVTEPEFKAIAFLMPNEVSYRPISDYAVSVDKIEEISGIDFFPNLMDKDMEDSLESDFDISLWNFDERKKVERIEEWNKRK